ncbi:DMT family transporter [Leuconostoc citreum]|uniref:DMT family transporter n=1 Tax=Leuconostoc citreum TaxID=33964 RepID=UPI0006608C70|nr:EamA family transporter [Leuconostoc citreum]
MTNKTKGLFFAMMGPLLWGVNSVAVDLLFARGVDAQWFASFRLLLAGVVLLVVAYAREGGAIFKPFVNGSDAARLVVFAFLGMLFVQYTYIMAIKSGNAATATVLQFTNPIMIAIVIAFKTWQWPARQDILAIIMAIVGTVLIATHGHIDQLTMSKSALIWGLLAGVGAVFYTLLPKQLIQKFDAVTISAWAMLISGLGINISHPIWRQTPHWTLDTVALLFFSIVIGTAIAYVVFIQSLAWIKPTTASTLGALEPLMGTILSVVVFHIAFGIIDALGAVLIMGTVFIQAMRRTH